MSLLTIGGNAKISKSDAGGQYLTAILHLAPAKLSGKEMCPGRSAGCTAACLNTAGRGKFDSIQQARINKTKAFLTDRDAFLHQLVKEIRALERKCAKLSVKPAVRLNGTSDLPWENLRVDGCSLMDLFPGVQFYDYTAVITRVESLAAFRRIWPKNYSLTFSLKEDNDENAKRALDLGVNVAAVFESLPETYFGRPVINGDASDLRFLDPQGVVVGLTAKGDAKRDRSGFVRRAVAQEIAA